MSIPTRGINLFSDPERNRLPRASKDHRVLGVAPAPRNMSSQHIDDRPAWVAEVERVKSAACRARIAAEGPLANTDNGDVRCHCLDKPLAGAVVGSMMTNLVH